jgi:hypothetical protein
MATIFTLDSGWNWLYHWYIQVNDVVVWPVARGVSNNLSVSNENMEVGLFNGKFTYYTRISNPQPVGMAFEFALTLPEYLTTFRGIEAPDTAAAPTVEQSLLAIVDAAGAVVGTLPRRRVAQAAGRRPAQQSDRAQGVTVLEIADDLAWRAGEDVDAFHARLGEHVRTNRSTLRQVDTLLPTLVPLP